MNGVAIGDLVPGLAIVAAILLGSPFLERERTRDRTIVALLLGLLLARYVAWRLGHTLFPLDGAPAEIVWQWLFFGIELLGGAEVVVFILIMSRHGDRRALAEACERRLAADGEWPTVDVFIPTYNEGPEVLERTIIGAKYLDYPDFRVHVLDDGRRDWLRAFCAAHGVGYLTRPDNAHAKAGNMNHALAHARGEFVAILDADFVPSRRFLRRTVGLFSDPGVGIVQTPQHFFNRDPVQMNLLIGRDWPDEQRLFFDEMAASRDAWDAAFCCGSCSVIRRRALDAIGGFPTASITEDLLTTLAMRRKGYRTLYLNERLSLGLAPESLDAYFVQRARWCRGGIQTLFLPEGPLGKGLRFLERVLFFPFSWIIQYPARLAGLAVPIVYFHTGLEPIRELTMSEVLQEQLPLFIAYLWFMSWIARNKYVPVLSTAIGVFTMFRLLPEIVASLVRPFGKPFHVTPKGRLSGIGVDWATFGATWALIVLTAAGMVVSGVPGLTTPRSTEFAPVADLWGVFNIIVLAIASLICFDVPRRRAEERFFVDMNVSLLAAGEVFPAHLVDASLGGARVRLARAVEAETVILHVPGVGELRCRVLPHGEEGDLRLEFIGLEGEIRERLIAHLFSGDFTTDQAAESGSVRKIALGLWRRIAGEHGT